MLGLVQGILLPFATGFVIAYVLAPVVARLERRGIPRHLGSLFVLILFLIGFAGILVVLVPLIQGQIVELITRVPNLVREIRSAARCAGRSKPTNLSETHRSRFTWRVKCCGIARAGVSCTCTRATLRPLRQHSLPASLAVRSS